MIYCCQCNAYVKGLIITGDQLYRSRPDLRNKYFIMCPDCHQYVGCHGRSTKPLGHIPTPEVRAMRIKIHSVLDPIWKKSYVRRSTVYDLMAKELGLVVYHTAEITSMISALRAYEAAVRIAEHFKNKQGGVS